MPELGMADAIISNPLFWICIILVILYFIIAKLREEKKRPEQRPFWGVEVRDEQTKKQLGKHIDVWGEKIGYNFYRGLVKIGVVMRFDPIYKYPNPDEVKDLGVDKEQIIETFAISFRKPGFVAWLNAVLLKKHENILLDPKAFVLDRNKKHLILDPKAYIIDDSSVWSLATKKELKIVDDLNLKKDHENVRGFVSDFPRRLSNLDPNQAIGTEKTSHIYAEEEKAKKNRVSQWAGNK
jgi:hypothetical protein